MVLNECVVDLCLRLECGPWAQCQATAAGAACVCQPCPAEDDSLGPVCGTDGRDYDSECQLRDAACRRGLEDLTVRHHGRCDACLDHRCPTYAICFTDLHGIPHCRCPNVCADLPESLVCGSDAVTYRTDCNLRLTSCEKNVHVIVAHRGPCVVPDACRGVVCEEPAAECHAGLCTCKASCPRDVRRQRLCGSDGHTYDSECHLQLASCRRPRGHHPITVAYQGECQDASVVVPDACRGVVCEEPAAECHAGLCTCKASCPRDVRRQRLCGSDGHTYDSECHLQLASCRRPRGHHPITVAYQGECQDASVDRGRQLATAPPCQTSAFGCCPDGLTPAGVSRCPPEDYSDECGCNRIGSLPGSCAGQGGCMCRPGVGGSQCDRCLPGFWGLANILQGQRGCLPCNCSPLGSVREDCEQMTGRCACRAGVQGSKCNICADAGRVLTSAGCITGQPFTVAAEVTAASVEVRRLGSVCSADGDCALWGSVCQRGACRCRPGLQSTHDGLRCLEYEVPAFDGESYIQLQCLKAYNKLNIEMEFLSYANYGILLYNQQKEDGIGDFVSLAIVEGFIEFRYDLGSGVVILRSASRIRLGSVHQVSARRYHRDGLLRLDDGPEVVGQSQGSLHALDLQMDAFVGGVPDNLTRVSESVGPALGLVGCVQQLVINQEEVRLHEGEPLVVRAVGVHECEADPCARMPCRNAGSCQPSGKHSFRCLCLPDYTGAYCETRVSPCISSPCVAGTVCDVIEGGGFTCRCAAGNHSLACQHPDTGNRDAFVPEFNGSSYIELPRLEGVARAFALEMWFLTNMDDGILLYDSQQLDGKGDYIALVLISGHIQFHFNLGSGPANMRTPNKVQLGKWHSVKVSRVDREGTLQLDNGPIARGTSGPPLTELNIELPLYVGGLPPSMNSGIIPVPNLSGAVQRLVINGAILENLGEKVETVSQWRGPPCSSYSCMNGGTCRPRLNSFVCYCPEKYEGKYCQYVDVTVYEETTPVKFSGKTYLRLSVDLDARHNSFVVMDGVNESWNYDTNDDLIQNNAKRVKQYNHNYLHHDVSILEFNESYNYISGDKQDKKLSSSDILHETGFAATSRSGRKHGKIHHYEITFSTVENNGLLLWCSSNIRNKSNYVAIAIVDGHVQLLSKRDKHKSTSVLKSKVFVSDGGLHTVVAQQRRITLLQVDNEQPTWDITVGRILETHSRHTLWLGGAANQQHQELYHAGFRGCIHRVVIIKQVVDMERVWDSSQALLYCHENASF